VERHLAALMALFDVEIEVSWAPAPEPHAADLHDTRLSQPVPMPAAAGGRMARILAAATN
jgi:hypothetical protein